MNGIPVSGTTAPGFSPPARPAPPGGLLLVCMAMVLSVADSHAASGEYRLLDVRLMRSPCCGDWGSNLVSAGGKDSFVARYDRDGNPLWARISGGEGRALGLGMAAGPGDDVHIAGAYQDGAPDFDGAGAVEASSVWHLAGEVYVAVFKLVDTK
jgi:hypothetical protein